MIWVGNLGRTWLSGLNLVQLEWAAATGDRGSTSKIASSCMCAETWCSLFLSFFARGFHPPAWSLGFSVHGGLRVAALFAAFLGPMCSDRQEVEDAGLFITTWAQKLGQCHFCCILLVKVLQNPLRFKRRGHRL